MNRKTTNRICVLTTALTVGVFSITLISSKSADLVHWTANDDDGIILVKNPKGPSLGYSEQSGVKILTVDGLAFKDLNKNGKLDIYEDWRRPVDERAKDLASKMSVEQIAGLMLYSAHQAIPSGSTRFGASTY